MCILIIISHINGENMTLSSLSYDLHHNLKSNIPDLKRSQVFELIAAINGYKSYKFLCSDTVLTDLIHDFIFNKNLFHSRCLDLCIQLGADKIDVIFETVKCSQIKSKIFFVNLYSIVEELCECEDFDLLIEKSLFKSLESNVVKNKCFNSSLCILVVLSYLIERCKRDDEYNLFSLYKSGHKFKDIRFTSKLETFQFREKLEDYVAKFYAEFIADNDFNELRPYFVDLNLDEDWFKFGDYNIIEKRFDKLLNIYNKESLHSQLIELWSLEFYAQKLGFDYLLSGYEGNCYAINSCGHSISDDWEFGDFDGIVEEEGREAIDLIPLSKKDIENAQKIAQVHFEKYQNALKEKSLNHQIWQAKLDKKEVKHKLRMEKLSKFSKYIDHIDR